MFQAEGSGDGKDEAAGASSYNVSAESVIPILYEVAQKKTNVNSIPDKGIILSKSAQIIITGL
ncbi:hypothetical protein LC613_29270 [Nostoc sphaeroides CHAB 2801]|uniref:Uncharacterized protein n=1 Tax=Nostoc sphaeroides CCNUC1 TaxID=2653204 RepID=A0A5P8W5Z3_9NOSO|nr:hypothetical protein [Nostoc sphaeroides]MCC5631798.1 hypothetical protein [Nostoc sphaeroides CHAB 2801]QFS48173.1 hypothetical protein GXM_05665 [Nostoc sphaeroides CCNUC1]